MSDLLIASLRADIESARSSLGTGVVMVTMTDAAAILAILEQLAMTPPVLNMNFTEEEVRAFMEEWNKNGRGILTIKPADVDLEALSWKAKGYDRIQSVLREEGVGSVEELIEDFEVVSHELSELALDAV
jgi:hypothetical protein